MEKARPLVDHYHSLDLRMKGVFWMTVYLQQAPMSIREGISVRWWFLNRRIP